MFDWRMVRPTHLMLVDALAQATAEANEGQRLLELDRDHWDTFVTEIKLLPEGRRQWYRNWLPAGDAGLVGVAWWTDYLGRRHFRVWAGHSSDGSFEALVCPDDDPRPPLWHIYPDRLFARDCRQRSGWLAACACGVPQAIAWMGPCCGACYERRGNGASPTQDQPDEPPTTFRQVTSAVRCLVFAPDGRRLAGICADERAHLWDLGQGGNCRAIPTDNIAVRALAFSPDGRLLALGCADRLVRLVDPVSMEERACFPCPGQVRVLAFAPDGRALIMGGSHEVEVWEREEEATCWRLTFSIGEGAGAAAFSQSGDVLALGLRPCGLMLLDTRMRGGEYPVRWAFRQAETTYGLALSSNGETLYSVAKAQLHVWSVRNTVLSGREQSVVSLAWARGYRRRAVRQERGRLNIAHATSRGSRGPSPRISPGWPSRAG
jgi:WD40 repeat protein